jgi:predicted 3'-5' exonuclease similar to PolB exonuclease domain
VDAVGAPHVGERTEKELISAFCDRIAELSPRLVTFNGHSFDLPVLRYRAMALGVSAPGLSARPYFHRYSEDAVDLCDVFSSFTPQGKATLHEISRVMGLPGKPKGFDGGEVERYFGVHRAPPGQRNPKDVGANAGPASAICVQSPQCSGPNLGDEPRDRLAILVGRILLQKVKAFDRYGLLVRLGAAEVPPAADEKASGVAVDEEFRDRAGREPLALWRTNRFGAGRPVPFSASVVTRADSRRYRHSRSFSPP